MSYVLLALLLSSQSPAGASTGWSRVQQLNAGTRISLTYVDGRSEDRVVEGGVGMADAFLGALVGDAVSPAHETREIIYRVNPLPESPI